MEIVIIVSAVASVFGVGFLFASKDVNLSFSDYKKAFNESRQYAVKTPSRLAPPNY